MRDKLNILIPQWQGGGQDLCTYYGAYALKENYLKDSDTVTAEVGTEDISPVKNDILGYDDIVSQIKGVKEILSSEKPSRIFTQGGGCDADIPCGAYLNDLLEGDMAMVYIDAHGDLNLPETSDSKLFYGMSLRTLSGDGDRDIIDLLGSSLKPEQLIMGANRALDPEEINYVKDNGISSYSVDEIENDPGIIAGTIRDKGLSSAYVHIDLDSLDPEEFRLTPVPEPSGLKRNTLLKAVKEIRDVCDIRGFAIMEYCGTMEDKGDEFLTELISIGLDI